MARRSTASTARTTTTRGAQQLPRATLGKRRATPFTYSPHLLEAIPFAAQLTPNDKKSTAKKSLWVSNNCLRFTSLCPVTGQPDWADITINYIPAGHLVESKSLKEYLNSFRMHGDFHEDVCRLMCADISTLIKPRYLEVIGQFDSRGSIAIWPYVQYAADNDAEMQQLLHERFTHYAPGKYVATYSRSI
jgi:7-cyano-7-deazaguanine reductase